jgi:hypothetical protein
VTPEEARALIAAMELLRKAMTDLPQALINNMTRTGGGAAGAGRAGATGGGGGAVGTGALALSLARLLGPLAALNTFLSATTSGFSVFSKAMALFATAVAPVLMPAFFLLSVALAATSEVLFTQLAPALEGFYRIILNYGIPVITQFVNVIAEAAEALGQLSDASVGGVKGLDVLAAGALPFMPGLAGPYLFDRISGGSGDGRAFGAAVGGGSGPGAGATRRAIADTLAELRLSMGPAASTGSIASVYTRAQMAAFQSPFERRMLEMMERVTAAISRAAGEPGAGRFTPGAAGALGGAAGELFARARRAVGGA